MGQKPMLLTVVEVCEILRIKRAKVYVLIEARVLEGVKIGADWRVRLESVEKLVGTLPQEYFKVAA